MGLLHLPTNLPEKSTIHVGKYTVPWMVWVIRIGIKQPGFNGMPFHVFFRGSVIMGGFFPPNATPGGEKRTDTSKVNLKKQVVSKAWLFTWMSQEVTKRLVNGL